MLEPANRQAALDADTRWIHAISDSIHDAQYAKTLHYLRNIGPERLAPGTTAETLAAFTSFGEDGILSELTQIAVEAVNFGSVTDLMFCYTAIPTVNGFCIKTPNLECPAVVLNHGLTGYIAESAQLTLGLTGWSGEPYCDHYPAETMLDSLFDLARGICEQKPAFLIDLEATRCVKLHDSIIHESMCRTSELFIILHELGHVTQGHLDGNDVAYAFGEDIGQEVPIFNRSKQQELEADKFAFMHLEKITKGRALKRDLAYNVGCLMILMRTVEVVTAGWASETHPSAAFRWKNLREEVGQVDEPVALDSIDYFFEWVEETVVAGRPLPGSRPAPRPSGSDQ